MEVNNIHHQDLQNIEVLYGQEVRDECERELAKDPTIDVVRSKLGWKVYNRLYGETVLNSPGPKTNSGLVRQ